MRHDLHASKPPVSWAWTVFAGAVLALIGVVAAASVDAAPAQLLEVGLWYNHSGKGIVEIRPCGDTGRDAKMLCGFIVWLKEPNNKKGEPLTDGYNENTSKRKRPICGLPVLGNLQRVSQREWDNGWVYDPEQGKSFDAAIALSTRDRLVLTGYKGIKFFSKSFVWKRAPDDTPRCTGAPGREAHAMPVAVKPPQPPASAKPLIPPRPQPAMRPDPVTR